MMVEVAILLLSALFSGWVLGNMQLMMLGDK